MDRGSKLVNNNARLEGHNLYQPAWYPGIKPEANATGVKGELYEITDEKILIHLDGYEGYNPDYPDGSLFVRKVVEVDGVPAYTYEYNHDVRDDQRIEDGDYKG